MKFLAPLVRRTESRYSLDDYVSWVSQMFGYGSFSYQGGSHPLGLQFTQPGAKSEPIGENFNAYAGQVLRGNGPVWTCEQIRLQVFTQARFQFRRLRDGRPGELFGTKALSPLEGADGGPNGDLLARMIIDADLAGSFYGVREGSDIVRLRPDWVDVIYGERPSGIGVERHGIVFWPDGNRGAKNGIPIRARDVVHFAPLPDPLASFRGMSWLTPVIREVLGDVAYSRHKSAFIDNAATPNLAVSLKEVTTPAQFEQFVEAMDQAHKGPLNAGKTLYLGGGADVTVVGASMKDLDFKAVQGAGETRIAAASGVGAVIAQFSEGMQGSSLNAGNYAASRRRFGDITMRHLWQEAASALANVIDVPGDAHLWYDARDCSFLQEDAKDDAEIDSIKATTIRTLVDGGFDPASVVAAIWPDADLSHTGKLSVQLQDPNALPEPSSDDD